MRDAHGARGIRCAHGSICARPRHRDPEIAKPARKAGLHTGRGRGSSSVWRQRASPNLADFRKPLWRAPAKCAQSQPLPGGLRCNPGGSFALNFRRSARLSASRNPARPGRYGAAASPVRCDSRQCPASRPPQLWHKARRWDRETRQPGRHGGIIGRTALDVLYALAFDFQNFRTGRLDPSLDTIARESRLLPPRRRRCARPAARSRAAGMAAAMRGDRDAEGRFRLRQRTNAYAVLPPSQWLGYRDTDPPPPSPDTLGAPERVPDPIEAAVAELTHGQRKASLAALEADPRDALAMALAGSAGRSRSGRPAELPECTAAKKHCPRFQTIPAPTDSRPRNQRHSPRHRLGSPEAVAQNPPARHRRDRLNRQNCIQADARRSSRRFPRCRVTKRALRAPDGTRE